STGGLLARCRSRDRDPWLPSSRKPDRRHRPDLPAARNRRQSLPRGAPARPGWHGPGLRGGGPRARPGGGDQGHPPPAPRHPRPPGLRRREVLLARRVTHPNVCRIFDVFQHIGPALGENGGPGASTLVLVMELVRGETLSRQLAAGGPLTPAKALPIICQLAE